MQLHLCLLVPIKTQQNHVYFCRSGLIFFLYVGAWKFDVEMIEPSGITDFIIPFPITIALHHVEEKEMERWLRSFRFHLRRKTQDLQKNQTMLCETVFSNEKWSYLSCKPVRTFWQPTFRGQCCGLMMKKLCLRNCRQYLIFLGPLTGLAVVL